jgi:hypothetical protein
MNVKFFSGIPYDKILDPALNLIGGESIPWMDDVAATS